MARGAPCERAVVEKAASTFTTQAAGLRDPYERTTPKLPDAFCVFLSLGVYFGHPSDNSHKV